MRALNRTTTAGLACAAALGLFAAVLPTAFTAAPAQAAPIVVPPTVPVEAPTNLALTGTATASSVESQLPGNTAAMAIDGNTGTRWSSNYVDDSWLQVELKEAGPIDNVRITWPNAAAKEFKLQTSMDGSNWKDVKTVTSTTGPGRTDEVKLDVDNTKFLRMQGVKRWSTYGYSISEFEIFAKAMPLIPESKNALIPVPVSYADTADGQFRLLPSSRIIATGDAVAAANYFAEKARKSTGFALPVVGGTATANDISVNVAAGLSQEQPDSYALQADAAGIRVEANTGSGALNGVQTLRQLFPQWIESDTVVNTPWTVDGVVIGDYPRYEHRGIQIDVARSFYTVDEMKEHIDNAAQFKFNRLHLHLTDDQGWRIAMDQPAVNPSGINYTDLTEISGKTAMTYNDAGVLQGTELGHTGFYTKADYKEIVSYAGENGMVVVPEIDMPGHTNAALHAIPALNSAGSAPKPAPGADTPPHQGSGNVGGTTFDADNPATYEFTKEVLTQLAAMTPGPYLHIGGDESHVTPHDKYVTMVDAFVDQVRDLDKQVIGWNEYSSANLPQGAVVQFWNGNRQSTANKILANDLKAILSPADKTYIPQKQDNSQSAGGTWACGGACTLQTHYDWNPENYLPGVMDDRILGVETVQWGEWIRGMEQTETYQYPRTLATAEVGWSQQADRNYADFTKRLGTLGGRMALQDINHFKTTNVNWSIAPEAPESKPTVIDPATLPETSPVDLGIPSSEFDGGDYVTLKNLPANEWLLLNIGTSGSGGEWVRSNSAGEAPMTIPTGLESGEHAVTVQGSDGELAGFATLVIAEEAVEPTTPAPTTTPPATTEPTVEPTEEPTVEPTTEPTTEPTIEPTDETTTPPATIEPTASATTTGPAVTDPATDGTTSAAPTQGTASPTAPAHGANQDDLASTGSTSTLMIGGAALALIAGLIILAGSRRRSSMH